MQPETNKAAQDISALQQSTHRLRRKTLWALLGTASALSLLAAGPAQAQNNNQAGGVRVNEIVVTATRRSESLINIPQSITAYTGDYLSERGFDDLADFAGLVPSLHFTERGPGRTSVNIRGVSADPGSRSVSTVGIYIDDVALTNDDQNSQATFNLFDIERIEVLNGPQGTLYGEGAMGGVVRYITNKPDATQFEGAVDVSGALVKGGDADYEANAMINIPIIKDRLALRVVGLYREQGGWIDAPLLGEKNFNSAETTGVRLSAQLNATENLTVTAQAMFNRIDVDGDNITRGGDKDEFVAPALNPRQDDFNLYSLTVDYVTPWFDITSVSGYSKRDLTAVTVDSDISLAFFVGPAVAIFSDTPAASSIFEFAEENENFTQELRFVSNGDGPLQWTAGFWYRDGDFQDDAARIVSPAPTFGGSGDLSFFGVPFMLGPNPLGGPLGTPITDNFSLDPSTSGFENIAVFGEASYDITDKLEILAGARWFEETRSTEAPLGTGGLNALTQLVNDLFGIPNVATDDEFSINTFTPKVTLSYKPNDDSLLYFTYAQGVRSGGRNGAATSVLGQDCRAFYDEDTTSNFEAGAKFDFLNGTLSVGAAAWYTKWKDLQVLFFDPVTFGSCVENAGEAHTAGIELSISAQPTDNLTLSAGGSYIEAETDEDFNGADFAGAIIPAGTSLPNVPEYKFYADARYVFPVFGDWDGVINGTVNAVGSSRAALEPGVRGSLEQPSYIFGNLRAGIQSENYGIFVYVNNLWDEDAVLADDTFGGIHRNKPRQIGVNLKANF